MRINERIYLLGSNLDLYTKEESVRRLCGFIEDRKMIQHVVINANKINLMQTDTELQKIVNSAPIINADGMSVVWAARLLKYNIKERVTGIDLFEEMVAICAERGYRPFYFGATEEVVKEVVNKHQEKYPSLKIAGYHHGYFKDSESVQIAEIIKASSADILFVAFSSPKKEYWINQYKEIMQVPVSMGVGGSFDVIAGKTKRAPIWMQKLGLEWFYRLLLEPRRMFKRYLFGNCKFIQLVIKEKVKQLYEKNS
ncbi:WecB/TagA/CpsF family glycosyltransferase [Listeria sp. PSOL-1]|uniref:WecB/TagA/CpsF family glycosyltransferase n=1 Tax=Listeria sp. PSOL-1 TaxID=1844999 RepID=UPI0018D8E5C5|nr:WecB/TagA/CpsF family glycosyltransferase [Listeria sp. PSOL-1]